MKNFVNLALTMIFFMVLPFTIFANSKEQLLQQCMPTRIDNPAPVGTILFVFEQQTIKRASDGVLTYRQLLKNVNNYSDYTDLGFTEVIWERPDNGNRIPIGCDQKNGKTPNGYGGKKNDTLTQLNSGQRMDFSIPDSTSVSNWMGKKTFSVRNFFLHGIPSVKAFFGPFADILLWILIICSPLICGLLGLALYFAETSASETIEDIMGSTIAGASWVRTIHQATAPIALLCCWAIMFVLLLWTLVWIVNQGLGLLGLAAWFFLLRRWASKYTSKLVPNIKMIGPGGTVVNHAETH